MTVDVEQSDRMVVVTVDRPEELNAIDLDVMAALEGIVTNAEASEDLALFVLRGAGERAFISGGDLKAFADLATAEEGAMMAARMGKILTRIEALPCFTLAALNGPGFGGGCETALAFDLRLCAAHATFGFTQGRFAVPPGWGGLTRLVELVGRSRALAWLGTSSIVEPRDALAAGLANWVATDGGFESLLDETCDRLLRNDRDLLVTLKSGAKHAGSVPRDEALRAELAPFARHWGSEAHHERVRAFLERSES